MFVIRCFMICNAELIFSSDHIFISVLCFYFIDTNHDLHQIPFSEFLLTNMGFVQNEQTLLNKGSIVNFGVLLADRIDGPFCLDIRHVRAISMTKELSNMDVDK